MFALYLLTIYPSRKTINLLIVLNNLLFNSLSFPEISYSLWSFPPGLIVLRKRDAKHIKNRHQKEFKGKTVEEFVESILILGADIYCEFESIREKQRVQIVNYRVGTAVLVYKSKYGECFYTVITAFNRRVPKGKRIGKLQ